MLLALYILQHPPPTAHTVAHAYVTRDASYKTALQDEVSTSHVHEGEGITWKWSDDKVILHDNVWCSTSKISWIFLASASLVTFIKVPSDSFFILIFSPSDWSSACLLSPSASNTFFLLSVLWKGGLLWVLKYKCLWWNVNNKWVTEAVVIS